MKSLDRIPAGIADTGSSRPGLPSGSGLLIAFGGSFLFWAVLLWAVL